MVPLRSLKDKKVKQLVQELLEHSNSDSGMKMIISKKSIKSLKPWLAKTEIFFKTLKLKQPSNIQSLQSETEKIFAILNISANKAFIKS